MVCYMDVHEISTYKVLPNLDRLMWSKMKKEALTLILQDTPLQFDLEDLNLKKKQSNILCQRRSCVKTLSH